uniref:Ribonuclease H n=1 Tax=Ditylenchus dipsaci TaxID=166011 RepID=A0A915DL85_9BILA
MPFYAVARGHTVGIYHSWGDCEKMVKGFKGAKYKKFNSKEEAEGFVDEHKSVTTQLTSTSNHVASSSSVGIRTKFKIDITETNGVHGKKRKHEDVTHENSLVKNVRALVPSVFAPKKPKPGSSVSDERSANIPIVYTDGACSNNGKRWGSNAAKAGYGVFWGDGHPDNTSAPVEGEATNNRAEYTAVIIALQQAILCS